MITNTIVKLDKISKVLNGIVGRLMVASFRDPVIKEAHQMTIDLGIEVDNFINELLGHQRKKGKK